MLPNTFSRSVKNSFWIVDNKLKIFFSIQAGRLNHANKCALHAELVALQIHLVNRAIDGHQIYCILGLNSAQVDILICETLT